jgi:hypothetical protein
VDFSGDPVGLVRMELWAEMVQNAIIRIEIEGKYVLQKLKNKKAIKKMEQKAKMPLWKKGLIGVVIAVVSINVLVLLFPIDYYETGMDHYSKQNYKEALRNFNHVKQSDKNYTNAISKIKEMKPIVDSLVKVEAIEKEKIAKKQLKQTEKEKSNEIKTSATTSLKEGGLIGTVGQSYEVGSLTYKVERVKFKKFIGGIYTLNKADGIFAIITLTVTNKSHKEILIDNSFFKLTDESGAEYGYSPDGTASLELSEFPGETFLGMSLNPNVAKKGKVVFELPTKNKNYKLVFTDPFSNLFLEIDMNS